MFCPARVEDVKTCTHRTHRTRHECWRMHRLYRWLAQGGPGEIPQGEHGHPEGDAIHTPEVPFTAMVEALGVVE